MTNSAGKVIRMHDLSQELSMDLAERIGRLQLRSESLHAGVDDSTSVQVRMRRRVGGPTTSLNAEGWKGGDLRFVTVAADSYGDLDAGARDAFVACELARIVLLRKEPMGLRESWSLIFRLLFQVFPVVALVLFPLVVLVAYTAPERHWRSRVADQRAAAVVGHDAVRYMLMLRALAEPIRPAPLRWLDQWYAVEPTARLRLSELDRHR